jgi:hypothetical protein
MSARPKLRLVHTGTWCATSQKYLQWRDGTGSWRFRRVVPKKLREVIGKTEWTETLKARNENEAIWLMQPHIAETDRIVALAETGNFPDIGQGHPALKARFSVAQASRRGDLGHSIVRNLPSRPTLFGSGRTFVEALR